MSRLFYPLCLLSGALLTTAAQAATLDEDVVGDFSDDRLVPTQFTLSAGSNLVSGHYGRGAAGGADQDYLRVDLPSGLMLTAIQVLPATNHGGGRSFIGVQTGPQLSVTPFAAEPADLLGYAHFTAVTTPLDILPGMGNALGEGFGAQGFTPPLPGPTYTFWIQETQASSVFDYRFNFQVSAVPLPAPMIMLPASLAVLVMLQGRRPNCRRRAKG